MACNCKNGTCSTEQKTKMITYEIKEENFHIAEQLERYYYEFSGLSQLLTQFTSTSPFKPDETRYNAILNEYMERFIQYNLLLDEIVQMAVEDLNISRLNIVNSTFSFLEKTLLLEIREEI